MATKTGYYNWIISSLQSEITALQPTVSELQKEMEGMKTSLTDASDSSRATKYLATESNPAPLSLRTLSRKEVEILISQMKAVCDEAIRANHENYVEMFAMQSEFNSLREHLETFFMTSEKFRDYQAAQEARFKGLEEKIRK